MTFWEGFALASSVWLFLCVVGVYLGYYAGYDQNITRWSDGYTEGYNDCIRNHQSELDEEEHGLNV